MHPVEHAFIMSSTDSDLYDYLMHEDALPDSECANDEDTGINKAQSWKQKFVFLKK